MTTLRLNQTMRIEIRSAALDSKFPKESRNAGQLSILERGNKLSEKVFSEAVGEATLKKIQESDVEHLFEFTYNNSMKVRCANAYTTILSSHNNNTFKYYRWKDRVQISSCGIPYQIRNVKLSRDVEKFISDREDHNKAYDEASSKLTAFLNSFTTMKQLKLNWPEGEVYYRKFLEDSPKRIVPAIIVSEINKTFGLPPKNDDEYLPEAQ